MKNILTFLSLTIFLIISCTDDNNLIQETNHTNNQKKKKEFTKVTNSIQIKSDDFTQSLLGKDFISNNNNSTIDYNREKILRSLSFNSKKTATLNGPFTYTVPVPPPLPRNQKIIYKQIGNTYPSTGVYFADIYSYLMKVELPANAVVAYVESVDKPGYANYTTQTRGFNNSTVQENGKLYLIANTYTMVLTYNIIGQRLDVVLPAPSGPKTFTYYYFTL